MEVSKKAAKNAKYKKGIPQRIFKRNREEGIEISSLLQRKGESQVSRVAERLKAAKWMVSTNEINLMKPATKIIKDFVQLSTESK